MSETGAGARCAVTSLYTVSAVRCSGHPPGAFTVFAEGLPWLPPFLALFTLLVILEVVAWGGPPREGWKAAWAGPAVRPNVQPTTTGADLRTWKPFFFPGGRPAPSECERTQPVAPGGRSDCSCSLEDSYCLIFF